VTEPTTADLIAKLQAWGHSIHWQAAARLAELEAKNERLNSTLRLAKELAADPYWFDVATAERALADELAEALRFIHDPETPDGSWCTCCRALAHHAEARK